MEENEKKFIDMSAVELKVDAETHIISGYASTFKNTDSYGDTILPGAYKNVIASGKLPVMFYGHKWDAVPVGKWTSMVEDEYGLRVTGQLFKGIQKADEVFIALKEGGLSGLSIGFSLSADDYEWKDDGGRVIKNISKLYEVSIVAVPADDKARVTDVRSAIEELKTIRDVERFMRDVLGLSESQALAFVSKFKAISAAQRESETVEKAEKQIYERIKSIADQI